MTILMMSTLYKINNLNSSSSLKQQSVERHVTPIGHIILIPSQPVFASDLCLAEKQQIPIL
jgi:hypothetical protein